jgi:hypothetical protein
MRPPTPGRPRRPPETRLLSPEIAVFRANLRLALHVRTEDRDRPGYMRRPHLLSVADQWRNWNQFTLTNSAGWPLVKRRNTV